MKIGILCSRIRLEEKLLLQAFATLSTEVVRINPNTLILQGKKTDFGDIDILLNREIAQTRAELILECAQKVGIRTVNSADATILCNNKAMATFTLQKAGIPVPATSIAFSIEQAFIAAQRVGYPLVVKPLWGSWGRLLSKVDSPEALESILEHKEALNSPHHGIFYLQEYIEKPDRDIRVFVIGGKPVTAMYRMSKHWLTNTAKGAVPKHLQIVKILNDLVLQTVSTLGIEVAGVDIVESKKGYLVLEVNATPEFHGLQEVSDINIAEAIAKYVTQRSEK